MAANEWYQNDFFWQNWRTSMFSKQMVDRATTEIDQILKLTNLEPKAHVLDMPCGVGRHTLELARRGFRVTGVDRSAEYLDEARTVAKAEGLEVEFVCSDMREFLRPNRYDFALNIGGSFGYFDSPEEDRMVVKNVYRSLKSGGVFVLDTTGKEKIAMAFQAREWHEENGAFLLQERKIIGDWESIEGRWIMFRDGVRHEATTRVRLYSAAELKALLRGCGFAEAAAYGSFDGTPYDTTARRLEMVARKERTSDATT